MGTAMTSRERVIAAVEFTGPDRIPHRHEYLRAVFEKYGEKVEELLLGYPSDFAGQDGRRPAPRRTSTKGVWSDEWGITYTVLRDGYLGQATGHPLGDLRALTTYTPPKACDVSLERQQEMSVDWGERYVAMTAGGIWERMIDLIGFEQVMYYLGLGSPELLQVRDMLTTYESELSLRMLELGPDAIYFSDDWGSQQAMMIAPRTWREVFLPSYRKLFEPIRAAGKHVFFHSDGYTLPILPDLVEAGVNAFWVDLTVNGTDQLNKALGGKVCFIGLTDVQFILREGTPEQAAQHGKDLTAALGGFNGGFIACTELAPDQPLENMAAILNAFREYGTYPLRVRWDSAEHRAVELPCLGT